ncbi:hypothetical protein [Bacillus cereus group sp. N21]|uniref:hypothetical protein n=1 Tax=Bacillus cereus group sp. N21 TaxID=2794591 RepID=UPI0018F4996A|nr:hypothetical protein [Bacillus cereus group sp. N21]MBJ8027749.1 hypothetical protein [Bacillus cereus group sp. N21]
MYEEFPNVVLLKKETKIWRYMDFTKFMSMLDKEEIFFTRSDRFADKFEGTFPKVNREMRPIIYKGLIEPEKQENAFKRMDEFANYVRKFVTVNCWHMNEYESAAMWDLYLKSDEGIAIQSNVGRLIESFTHSPQKIIMGKVDYKDFNKELLHEEDLIDLFFYKRKSFEHEREIRAIHQLPFVHTDDGCIDDEAEPTVAYGLGIPCDIRVLIEKVYISPTASSWFEELVRSMCEKFNLKVDVIKSELSELPY